MHLQKFYLSCLLFVSMGLLTAPAIGAPPGVGGPMRTRSVYIFPEQQGAQLLKQCSRKVPQDISGYWTPTEAQVTAFQAALGDFLKQHSADRGQVLNHVLDSYHGQYTGIVSSGKRLIYGNFYLRQPDMLHEDTKAADICDGGRDFFGAVFDPAVNKVVDLAFNGEG